MLEVHERGSLATAVRASLSLPGIFPPVRQGSDFLVDGGVLNNLPVDVMRTASGEAPHRRRPFDAVEVGAPANYRETPSGWSLLADQLRGKKHRTLPHAIGVLMRAKDLAAIRAQRELLAGHAPDVLVHPQLERYGAFDYKAAQDLIDVAIAETIAQLETSGWLPRTLSGRWFANSPRRHARRVTSPRPQAGSDHPQPEKHVKRRPGGRPASNSALDMASGKTATPT